MNKCLLLYFNDDLYKVLDELCNLGVSKYVYDEKSGIIFLPIYEHDKYIESSITKLSKYTSLQIGINNDISLGDYPKLFADIDNIIICSEDYELENTNKFVFRYKDYYKLYTFNFFDLFELNLIILKSIKVLNNSVSIIGRDADMYSKIAEYLNINVTYYSNDIKDCKNNHDSDTLLIIPYFDYFDIYNYNIEYDTLIISGIHIGTELEIYHHYLNIINNRDSKMINSLYWKAYILDNIKGD